MREEYPAGPTLVYAEEDGESASTYGQNLDLSVSPYAAAFPADVSPDFPEEGSDLESDPLESRSIRYAVYHSEENVPSAEPVLRVAASALSMEDVFAPSGPIARAIPDFKPRSAQLNMAKSCAEAFAGSSLSIVEAGTGTGKTFAYLAPALLQEGVTVISTGSKALQDQIVKKDLPQLLYCFGMEITPYMVLKGFSNYLCRAAFDRARSQRLLSEKEIRLITELADEAEALMDTALPQECTYAEVNSRLPPAVAARVTCDPVFCVSSRCPHVDNCFPRRARQAALNCKVVVINHALFLSSLSATLSGMESDTGLNHLMSWLLPDYQHLILDEAHTLIDFGRHAFAEGLSQLEIEHFNRTLVRGLKEENFECASPFQDCVARIDLAMQKLRDYILNTIGERRVNLLDLKYGEINPSDTEGPFNALPSLNKEFHKLVSELYLALKSEALLVRQNREMLPELFDKVETKLDEAMEGLVNCMNVDKLEKKSVDGERDLNGELPSVQPLEQVAIMSVTHRGFVFELIPLSISQRFASELDYIMGFGCGVVMTSATLSVRGAFDKFLFDLGLKTFKPNTSIVPSVFDYAERTRLYVAADFPPHDAPAEERISAIVERLTLVMDQVDGGIFFLTTSYTALTAAYRLLRVHFEDTRLVLCQGQGLSNFQLMRKFKEDGRALLIGTSSFWEGVDVPGRALSLVIIDKLPFKSPADPFHDARCRLIESRGGKPFMEISIPEAVISLRQGVGRLIRKESDYGALIICDPRLVTKSYGKLFLNSLPPLKRVSHLEEVSAFLSMLSSKESP